MASIVGRVDIALALVPSSLSIIVVSPTRRHSPSSCPFAPSIAVVPRSPSPLSRHRAVHCHPLPLRSRFITIALVPSLAVHHCQGAVVPDFFKWPRQQFLVVPCCHCPSLGSTRALACSPPRAFPGDACPTSMEAMRMMVEPPPPTDQCRPLWPLLSWPK